jgi:hypothetical protein
MANSGFKVSDYRFRNGFTNLLTLYSISFLIDILRRGLRIHSANPKGCHRTVGTLLLLTPRIARYGRKLYHLELRSAQKLSETDC